MNTDPACSDIPLQNDQPCGSGHMVSYMLGIDNTLLYVWMIHILYMLVAHDWSVKMRVTKDPLLLYLSDVFQLPWPRLSCSPANCITIIDPFYNLISDVLIFPLLSPDLISEQNSQVLASSRSEMRKSSKVSRGC